MYDSDSDDTNVRANYILLSYFDQAAIKFNSI